MKSLALAPPRFTCRVSRRDSSSHRFDVLRRNALCAWAIPLSASEQVSRETMENNRVRRASTRAAACQRLRTCLGGVGGVGVAHGILGRFSSVAARRIAGISETPAPGEESIIYSARIQDFSLCLSRGCTPRWWTQGSPVSNAGVI